MCLLALQAASALRRRGASPKRGISVLAARRVERLTALAAELGDGVVVVGCDVARPHEVRALAEAAVQQFGRIDVWVNNAGVGGGAAWWAKPEAIEATIATNLSAVAHSVGAALPYMRQAGGGHFINVGSVNSHIGVVGLYSATKFGVRGLSEALRRELAPDQIKVSLVTPGFIETEMTQGNGIKKMPPPSLVAKVISQLIRRPRREVVVPGWYRLLILINRWLPGLTDWLVVKFFVEPRRQSGD